MTTAKPADIKFSDELIEAYCARIVERVERAVRDSEPRNQDFDDFYRLFEGIEDSSTEPWDNACDVVDPIILEQFLQLFSSLWQALRNPPYVMVEAVTAEDENSAMRLEQWINPKASQAGFSDALYDVTYNALIYRLGWMYCGWQQQIAEEPVTYYREPGGDALLTEDMREEGVEYEEETVIQQTIVKDGPEYRSVLPWDFYVYPSDAPDIDRALGCGERMYLTREDLLAGIDDMGFDEDAVHELLRLGPTGIADDANREERTEEDGTASATSGDEYYECYLWFGRLPLVMDDSGNVETPRELQKQDFLWMLCPKHHIVFKFERSPFPLRPYAPFYMLRRPGRLMGHCLPEILEPFQTELTATHRAAIDTYNLTLSPAVVVPTGKARQFTKTRIKPGAVYELDDPTQAVPLKLDSSGVQAGMAIAQDIRARAAQVASSQTAQLQPKVRKAIEVQAAAATQDTKFDLYLSTILGTVNSGIPRAFLLTMASAMAFLGDDGDETYAGKENVRVETEDLKKAYKFIPHASTEMANPEARLQNTMLRQQVANAYLQMMASAPPHILYYAYHSHARALENLGVRDVENWIGPQPPDPDMLAQMQQQMMMQMAQGVAAGDSQAQQAVMQMAAPMLAAGPPLGEGDE